MTDAGGRAEGMNERSLTHRALHVVGRFYGRVFHRLDVLSPPTLPASGAAILVCNHCSHLDPILLQSVVHRPIVWMMAREFYDIRALTWLFRLFECIPVDRNGRDMSATRAALRALKQGHVLGVFPEGKIEKTRELLPFQPGVALLAMKAGVDIYPAYLDGDQRRRTMLHNYLLPRRATISFGPCVRLHDVEPDKTGLAEAAQRILHAVDTLRAGAR